MTIKNIKTTISGIFLFFKANASIWVNVHETMTALLEKISPNGLGGHPGVHISGLVFTETSMEVIVTIVGNLVISPIYGTKSTYLRTGYNPFTK